MLQNILVMFIDIRVTSNSNFSWIGEIFLMLNLIKRAHLFLFDLSN